MTAHLVAHPSDQLTELRVGRYFGLPGVSSCWFIGDNRFSVRRGGSRRNARLEVSMPDEGRPDMGPQSIGEMLKKGKSLRSSLPRSGHAELSLPDRDPVRLIAAQNESRLADLVPVRIGRMLQSPFAYYRGTAAVMAHDLAAAAVTGQRVVCCGDAHISNFGLFASPERRLLFDLNDFDEASTAPWEWDVKRLAASVVIGGRDIGLTETDVLRVGHECGVGLPDDDARAVLQDRAGTVLLPGRDRHDWRNWRRRKDARSSRERSRRRAAARPTRCWTNSSWSMTMGGK